MQRVREAPPATSEERAPSIEAMPSLALEARDLLARMEALREPGVTSDEVDAFLVGLSAPPPPGEPPRVRADVLLDVLEDERLCVLTGTDGRRVGIVALESLLGLGYPYALEVTPEMLSRARGSRPVRRLPRHLRMGLWLTLINVLLPVGTLGQDYLENSQAVLPGSPWVPASFATSYLPFVVMLLLGPPVLSVLAGWYRLRPLQRLFNGTQWALGLLGVLIALNGNLVIAPVNATDRILSLATGALTLVTAISLRTREDPKSEP